MPDERPFFVIGQWSGPDLTVWQIQQAPDDPDELDDEYEQHRCDAYDADGGVEIVCAASAGEAEATARREAIETGKRTGQDLKRRRERRAAASRHRRKVAHHYT
ncbi:hypothetical protein AB0454_36500 [Streptomyces sp. NPDC093509]|uniref:hypothetical protein n=1 Tax=Streptomyces sp. NPDC093509 TaxID=3154982 RepID=UPI00344E46F2